MQIQKWYLFPNKFFDDSDALLLRKVASFLKTEDETIVIVITYRILDRPAIVEDWERGFRPTEDAALENLFRDSLKAERRRFYGSI